MDASHDWGERVLGVGLGVLFLSYLEGELDRFQLQAWTQAKLHGIYKDDTGCGVKLSPKQGCGGTEEGGLMGLGLAGGPVLR